MSTPIQNKVSAILIPVKDLTRSAEFYTKILGQELGPVSGPVYNLDIDGTTEVVLDCDNFNGTIRNGEVSPSPHPLCTFETENLDKAYEFLVQNNIEVDEIQSFGNVGFFHFKDLDGNKIMIHGHKA